MKDCTKCKLCEGRTQVVAGRLYGNKENLMFIGEAPGRDEDKEGKPFVGKSGQLLRDFIKKAGLTDYYITNIVKCRPPDNRDPEQDEIDACEEWIKKEFLYIKPKFIVTVGRISTQAFLGDPKAKITKIRGEIYDFGAFKMMPVLHPAYILRYPEKGDYLLADLKKVKGELSGN